MTDERCHMTAANIPLAGRAYTPIVTAAARKYGIVDSLIYAVIQQESAFRPAAFRAEPRIKDGSHGLMQLLYRTAKALGYSGEVGEPKKLTGLYDPATNIGLGAKLLAENLRLTGSIEGAVSAYNGGFRPHLGFGKPAAKALTVCLARDQKTGECIRRREVPPGEYANQSYVAAVMARMEVYAGSFGPNAA